MKAARLLPTPSTAKIETEIGHPRHGFPPSRDLSRRTVLAGTAAAISAAGLSNAHAAALTPEMTTGPFYPSAAMRPDDVDADLVKVSGREADALGQIVHLSGRVVDTQGRPLAGALVEIWQTDANGRYHHDRDRRDAVLDEGFQGFGQVLSGADGEFHFRTVKPVQYPLSGNAVRTPHIHVRIEESGREMLVSQLFFEAEPLNDQDALLRRLSEEERARVTFALEDGASLEAGSLAGAIDIVV